MMQCITDARGPDASASATRTGHPLPVLGAGGDLCGQLAVPAVRDGNASLGTDLGGRSDAGCHRVTERPVVGDDDDPGADPAQIVDHRNAFAVMTGQEITEPADLRSVRPGQPGSAGFAFDAASITAGVAHHGQPRTGSPTTESTAQATEMPVRYRFEMWNSIIGLAAAPRSTRMCSRCAIARNHRPSGTATAA